MCVSRWIDGLFVAAMSSAIMAAGCPGRGSAPEPATAAATAESSPSAEELAQLEAEQVEAQRVKVIEAWRRSVLRRELCPQMPEELRDRRLAWNEQFEIALCEMATTLAKMPPLLRERYQEPEKRRHMLDNLIRYKLLVHEARRRGYAHDDEVQRLRKQMMIQRLRDQLQESARPDDLTEELRREVDVKVFDQHLAKAKIELPGQGSRPTDDATAEESRRSLPIAHIGSTAITLGQLEDRLDKMTPVSRRQYNERGQLREVLEQMVDWELRAAEAERRGLGHDLEIMDQVERTIASLLVRHQVDERVTPEDIMDYQAHDYYQQHIDRYHRPERVRASHILISDGGQAQELLEKMRATGVDNAEFHRLARELSEDGETKHRSGDLRYFPRVEDRSEDDPEIPEHLVTAAFELYEKRREASRGQGSAGAGGFDPLYPLLIKCDRGFHIVRFTGHRDPVKREFETVERQIRNRLWRENLEQAREQFIERLKARNPVTIDEDALLLVDDALQALEQPPAPEESEAGTPTSGR